MPLRAMLARALQDGEPHDWGAAASLIRQMGTQGASFQPVLLDLLRRPLPHRGGEGELERLESLDRAAGRMENVLGMIAAVDPGPVWKWSSIPEDWWSEHQCALYARYGVINALAEIAPSCPEVADAIAALSTEDDRGTRVCVVLALRDLIVTPQSTAALRELAKDPHDEVGPFAVKALHQRGVN